MRMKEPQHAQCTTLSKCHHTILICRRYDSYFFQSTFFLAVAALIVMTLTSGYDFMVPWTANQPFATRNDNFPIMFLTVVIALQLCSVSLLAINFWFTDLRLYLTRRCRTGMLLIMNMTKPSTA